MRNSSRSKNSAISMRHERLEVKSRIEKLLARFDGLQSGVTAMANVSVEIMGQNLVVASDADADWVRAVARAVDERGRTIRARARAIKAVDQAILTALNFADELERLRIEYRELLEQIDALNKRLSESFEGNE